MPEKEASRNEEKRLLPPEKTGDLNVHLGSAAC